MSQPSEWQNEECRCGVVLGEVFSWLGGRSLARAGATCHAWRRAASDPSLWRRLLLNESRAEPTALHHLCDLRPQTETVSWRQEYVTACAGWSLKARHLVAGGAMLLHAALAPSHDVLALGAEDASLAVWRLIEGSWREVWRTELRARGWAAVARVQWARHAPALLLAGPRVLIDDWELMVIWLDDDYRGGTVASRVRCSAGAAGCWADSAAETFISLELRYLGPGLACTIVYLNSATQETQSEYAGVMSPLLRVFNEDHAHISHAIVATLGEGEEVRRVLIVAMGSILGSWPVVSPRPSPLLVGAPGELAARVRRYRARQAEVEEEPPVPDEASVRSLCAPPDHDCRLDAPVIGLTLDDNARFLWVSCSDSAVWCVCARSLAPQYCVRTGRSPASSQTIHYVQPAVTTLYVASPEGAYSPRVWVWSLRSGAGSECGGGRRDGGKCTDKGQRSNQAERYRRSSDRRDNDDRRHSIEPVVNNAVDESRAERRNNSRSASERENMGINGNERRDYEGIQGTSNHDGHRNDSERNDEHQATANRDGSRVNAWHRQDSEYYDCIGEGDSSSDNEYHVARNGDHDKNAAHATNSEDESDEEADIKHASLPNDVNNNIGDNGENNANNIGENHGFGEDGWHTEEPVDSVDRNSLRETVSEVPDSNLRQSDRRLYEQHLGAAVCALLPRNDPDSLLVLAADSLYIWRRRATVQPTPEMCFI